MKVLPSLVLILSLILFYMCSSDVTGTNDESVTGTKAILLVGKVLDEKNNGVSNVVVKLHTTGFSDTTDSSGIFNISAEKDSIEKLGLNLDTLKDTLEYSRNNELITSVKISNWIDTLPDVYMILRNVSGNLLTTYTDFKRIEAILIDVDDTLKTAKCTDLWLSLNTFNYSGYLYFLNDTLIHNYSLYINVYNKDSLLVGRSATEFFPSTAGDIEFGPFDPFNALPKATISSDTNTVSINDSIAFSGIVIDSFGGTVSKWEWDIGNTGLFTETNDGKFTTIAPSISNDMLPAILKIMDNDGNVSYDTTFINVLLDAPKCSAYTLTPVLDVNDTILLNGYAVDVFGSIEKWEWDVGNYGEFVETSDGNYKAIVPLDAKTHFPCVLKVTDDDGVSSCDTLVILSTKLFNPTVNINNGDSYTNLKDVKLKFDMVDLHLFDSIRVAESETELLATEYRLYNSNPYSYELSENDGLKKLYVQFKNDKNDESNIVIDSIYLEFGAIYVSIEGSDSTGNGTRGRPFQCINTGMALAKYFSESTKFHDTVKVSVSEGEYVIKTTIDMNSISSPKSSPSPIAIYGGYFLSNWDIRNAELFLTKVKFSEIEESNCPVFMIDDGVIDGFQISKICTGEIDNNAPAIYISSQGLDGPIISNNTIFYRCNNSSDFVANPDYEYKKISAIYSYYSVGHLYNNNILLGGSCYQVGVAGRYGNLSNNTIISLGADVDTLCTAIRIFGDHSYSEIFNNMIVNVPIVLNTMATFRGFSNNNVIGFTTCFANSSKNYTLEELENEFSVASNNVSVDIIPFYENYINVDTNDNDFYNLNLRLLDTTPDEIKYGGQVLTPFTVDKDGNLRTDPWTIGPYEKD